MSGSQPSEPVGERARALRARVVTARSIDELIRVARKIDKTPLPEREHRYLTDVAMRRTVELLRTEREAEERLAYAAGAGFEIAPHCPTEPALT